MNSITINCHLLQDLDIFTGLVGSNAISDESAVGRDDSEKTLKTAGKADQSGKPEKARIAHVIFANVYIYTQDQKNRGCRLSSLYIYHTTSSSGSIS